MLKSLPSSFASTENRRILLYTVKISKRLLVSYLKSLDLGLV